MEKLPGELGIVVNYYTNFSSKEHNQLLVASTSLSLRLLKINPFVNSVILVDGSQKEDKGIKKICEELEVKYFHSGKEISYVEAYNIGWKSLPEPYIGLMANDVIPHPLNTIERLLKYIKKKDIGCVFPYMNTSRMKGDETQQPGFLMRGRITCEPSSMTLNLNLFKRNILQEIDGLDEKYLSGFQEPILILKIRSMGYRVVLVGNTRIFHFDRLTKDIGESSIEKLSLHKKDKDRWYEEYPRYSSKIGIAQLLFYRIPFCTTLSSKLLWWISYHFPIKKYRKEIMKIAMWLEPFLTKYPAKYGKSSD